MHSTRFIVDTLDEKVLRIVALTLALAKELEQEHGSHDAVLLSDAASDAIDIFPGLEKFLAEQRAELDWDDINGSLFDASAIEAKFNQTVISFAKWAAAFGARFFICGDRLLLDDIDELEGLLESAQNYDMQFGQPPHQDVVDVFCDEDSDEDSNEDSNEDGEDTPPPPSGGWLN